MGRLCYTTDSMKTRTVKCLLTVFCAVGLVAADAADTLENRHLRLERRDDGTVRLFRVGAAQPFAEWNGRLPGARLVARLSGDAPFAFIDVTPLATDCARVVGAIDLPKIRLADVDAATWRLMGSGGITNAASEVASYAFLALGEPKSRRGYVAAWLTDEWASGSVSYGADGLGAKAEYGPMTLMPGAADKTDTLVLGAFDDCRLGLEAYADAVARHYAIALPPQMSGFCTWYSDKGGYTPNTKVFARGACSEELTRTFIDTVHRLRLDKWGFGYYQIDDMWQDGKKGGGGPAKVFGRVDPNGPYPKGMKPTADYIRARGLVAGLWYMPFSGEMSDPWWSDKSNLCVKAAYDAPRQGYRLRQTKGLPYTTPFGASALDMSNPEALAYVKDTAARLTRDWGYRLLKFDGMYSGMAVELGLGRWYRPDDIGNQVFQDREISNAQAFRRGLKAMREGCAPGTQLLACNVKQNARGIVASYGLVEMLRIGGDNGPIDSFPQRYMAGPLDGSPRYFLNGRVWYNDPDPVYVRDAVSLGRARMMASWTAIGGLLYNFSDWLPDLSEGRVEILRRTLAPHGRPRQVRPVDFFERTVHNVWKLTDGDRAVFGLYNWDTNAVLKIDYPAAYADLDPAKTYVGYDFWEDRFVPPFKGRLAAEVAPDSCRVLAVRELLDRPFVLSTSRHVASPVFDVVSEKWDAAERTLTGMSRVVACERYELRVVVNGQLRRFSFTPDTADFAWRLRFD